MKLGVDLGGTNIRVGLVNHGRLIGSVSALCPSRGTEQEVLDHICGLITQISTPEVTGIGIGVPSVVDVERGIVYHLNNIPSWKEVHLKEYLENRFSMPVEVNNDANCFALGEYHFGVGKGTRNMVGLVMGTGIGSGVIINGELYLGVSACAGEVGALPFKDKNYEYYCSSRFFALCHGDTGKNFGERALEGDKQALTVWEEFGENVGELMKAVMFTYAPEVIVIGGGISNAFPFFEQAMRRTLASFPFPEVVKGTRVVPSSLENVAILGASILV